MMPAPLQVGQAPSELALNSAGFTPLALANALRIGSSSPVYVAGFDRREPRIGVWSIDTTSAELAERPSSRAAELAERPSSRAAELAERPSSRAAELAERPSSSAAPVGIDPCTSELLPEP